jgi:hypothetical protein
MRKIMLCFMLLLGMAVFAEKLTTDGKSNLNLLMGKWANGTLELRGEKEKLFFISIASDGEVSKDIVKNYKPNVYVIENYYLMPNKKDKNFYFAWDSKYKTMVELDKDLNIISKITRKITGPAG